MLNILLIEDDRTIADFICRGLKQAGYCVEYAADGKEGLALALGNSYDAGIVDIMLPHMDGLAIIDRLRAEQIALPIIILSAKRSVDDRIAGLQHGGDDYLIKPFSFSELLARVQALVRRSKHDIQSTSLTVADLTIDLLARTVRRGERKVSLQPREFALLEYLMRNAGHVVSRTMIMERVWDYNFDPQTNVIEARISKLREKIDRDFSTPLIHTVRGLGYVLRENDD